jgi:DNA processing protein
MSSRSSTPEGTKYWIALDRVFGLGSKKFDALERAFPTMKQAWNASPAEITDARLDQAATQKVVERRDSIDPDDELSKLADSGESAITRQSSLYPTRLAQIYDPPAVIHVRRALTEADQWRL